MSIIDKIYIDINGDNSFSEECEIVLESRLTYTLDETRDSGIVAIKSTKTSKPYRPCTLVKIPFENGTSVEYWAIKKDDVSFFGRVFNTITRSYEIVYKHSLTLEQTTYIASKYMCRDFVFSQPADNRISLNSFMRHQTTNSSWNAGQQNNFLLLYSTVDEYNKETGSVYQCYFIGDKTHIENQKIYFDYTYYILKKHAPYGDEEYATSEGDYIKPTITIKAGYENSYDSSATLYNRTHVINVKKHVIDNNVIQGRIELDLNNYSNLLFPRYNYLFVRVDSVANTFTPQADSYWYTFFISINTSFEYFNYTHRDILTKLSNCTPLTRRRELEAGIVKPVFKVPYSINNIDLDSKAPQMTITQSTLYDALCQWANYFDAIPVFRKARDSADFELDLEFPDLRSGRQEISREIINTFITSIDDSDNSYVDAQLAVLKNITKEDGIVYPSERGYTSVRSGDYGVVDADDLRIILPYNIREIKGLYVPVSYTLDSKTTNEDIDISYFVVEQELYTSLPDTWSGESPTRTKQNCLYYIKGTNYIPIGTTSNPSGYYEKFALENVIKSALNKKLGEQFTNLVLTHVYYYPYNNGDFDPYQLQCRVKYVPLLNSIRVRSEGIESKHAGETLANQGSSTIDVYRASANLYGLSNRTGIDRLDVSFKFSKWQDRIVKGDIYYKDDDVYIANVVSYSFFKDYIECYVSFSKNFNRINSYIGVDREKRFYEADNSLTLTSEDSFSEYIYIAKGNNLSSDEINAMRTHVSFFKPFWVRLLYTFVDEKIITFEEDYTLNPFSVALINTFSYGSKYSSTEIVENVEIPLTTFTLEQIDWEQTLLPRIADQTFTKVYMPAFSYYGRNQLSFHASFSEPLSAGSFIIADLIVNGEFVFNNRLSKAVLYTDPIGNFDRANISFYAFKNIDKQDEVDIMSCIPFFLDSDINDYLDPLFSLNNVYFMKDTNEILALNYNIYYVTLNEENNDIFIGKTLLSQNNILKGARGTKATKVYYSSDKFTRFDQKGFGTMLPIRESPTTGSTDDYCYITFDQLGFDENKDSQGGFISTSGAFKININFVSASGISLSPNNIAICDENDNILLAFNDLLDDFIQGRLSFFIFSSRKRL